MNAAAWTVAGVFLGAALQFIANVWSERRADRRAEADRDDARDARAAAQQEAREARLFDARRIAYEAFISSARAHSKTLWGYAYARSGGPDVDFADDLMELWGRINLYAYPDTTRHAEKVVDAVLELGNLSNGRAENLTQVAEVYGRLGDALEAFARSARIEMGSTPR